jgi:hypothetical protein
MGYLHEIAVVLLPQVRRAALRPESAAYLVRLLAKRCEEHAGGAASGGEATEKTRGVWLSASDVRATEVLVDVLVQMPGDIPKLLKSAAPQDFYPSFLTYLTDTVTEAAQPRYRPTTWIDRAWWYVWTWFAASEYAAQLRDRHERVARELAKTDAWKRVRPPAPHPREGATSSEPASTSTPGAPEARTRPHAKERARQFRDNVKIAVGDAWEKTIVLVGLGPSDDEWEQVRDLLSGESDTRHVFLTLLKEELLRSPALVRRLAEVTGAAVPFDFAFDLELMEVRASRAFRLGTEPYTGPERSPFRTAADLGLFGVAFSGGGIRSATFNLGVLQGLASHRLLREVDYLSTVSGGGYVGAWLASWIKRAHKRESGRGVQVIEDRLRTEPIGTPDAADVRAVRFLREYSNYLAPRPGILSADTWTMIAIWLRNTMLNQAVLVLALAGMLMAPWTIWFTLVSLLTHPDTTGHVSLSTTAPVLLIVATLLMMIASGYTGQQLLRFNLSPDELVTWKGKRLDQIGVITRIVVPVTLAAFCLSIVICSALPHLTDGSFRRRAIGELTGIFAIGLAIVAFRGRYWQCFWAERLASVATTTIKIRSGLWAFIIISLAILVASFVGAAIVVGLGSLVAAIGATTHGPPISLHLVAFAVPTLIATMSMMVVLKLGILGRNLLDYHREWWSRLGAWLNIVSLAWLVLFVISLYSPYLVTFAHTTLRKYIVASGGIGWAAWTAAGVLLARSGTAGVSAAFKQGRMREIILALAPYVFIAGLLVIISTAFFWIVVGILPTESNVKTLHDTHWTQIGQALHWILLGPLGLVALAFLLSCRVDINEFSMHHMYKNRLVRSYLGASREERDDPSRRSPDPFTGFDAKDDLSLADLQVFCGRGDPALRTAKRTRNPRDLEPYVGPIPIVNTALNLVKGDDLAWQERKAQSFAFTPFYSGYDFHTLRDDSNSRFAPYGFRPTLLYGYPPFGIATGTAIAISGAAANPNMGYHSSPAASFLMTMFNARLGWWMGNPRDKYNWLRSGPRRGLLYLLNELFGLTNDRTHFVNLSDGGHFENLGIYELVRRRCRYIIASDAEQDEALTFSGLGNAIRKCRMDFGVEISLRATRIQPPSGAPRSTLHCVVGDITYPNGETGTLLYLKASVTGDEPDDVLEYKARQPEFPHHSTMGDQFFDESQFESYRKLGVHITQTAFAVPNSAGASLAERFGYLRDYWYPPSAAADRTGHAVQYDALLDRVRMTQKLAFIDSAFFEPAPTAQAERQKLFLGASMLDLMQRVFVELDLENDRDHPHNAGWMVIFGKWMRQEAVQHAWEASRANYGRRFQRFVDQITSTNGEPK